MSGTLCRKYSGTALLVLCMLFIVRELANYVTPPCRATLHSLTDIHEVLIKVERNDTSLRLRDSVVRVVNSNNKHISDSPVFTKHRIKIWYGGRCFDAEDDKHLVVSHCNPDLEQTFSLSSEGRLIYDRTKECVVRTTSDSPILGIGSCSEAVLFQLLDNSYLQTLVEGITLCVSQTSQLDTTKPNMFSCLGVPISLTECNDEASQIQLIEEAYFKEERSAFADAVAPDQGTCDFKACGLNVPSEPVQMLRPIYSTRCQRVFDCVTVVTKTARRPYLVMRLAQSIRDIKGYDLRIISYDDGPNDYPAEVWQKIGEYPHLQYIVGDDEDMGISRGRNLALELVKTKYFLLVDDDHVFNNKSNIEKMVEVLDTTDATLVGGKFQGFMKFAGALRFGHYHSRQEFAIFSGHCERELPKFPSCEQCDTTSNIFLARVQPILEIKGWSEELKIAEHADFFVKLKAFGKKVVYCDDIEVINQQESPEERSLSYQKLRYDKSRKNRMFRLMNSRYNVNGLFWCSEYRTLDNGELLCLQTKHKIGYC